MKNTFFPIYRNEWKLFSLLFSVVCLININCRLLRSTRSALVVADSGGAELLPYFEFFGVLPMSILMTWGLSALLMRYSIKKVFNLAILFFISFFVLYAVYIYPYKDSWQFTLSSLDRFSFVNVLVENWNVLIFYIMAELWKVVLLTVLFWGFVNRHLLVEEAKRYYAPLMLGGSVGAMIAGPVISYCTSEGDWAISLKGLMYAIFAVGVFTIVLFQYLSVVIMERRTEVVSFDKPNYSFSSSLNSFYRNTYLWSIAGIVFADYLVYSLWEIVYLDLLKVLYPDPNEYCRFMGYLGAWSGFMTFLFALAITPFVLQRYSWAFSALITPVLVLITSSVFFSVLWFRAVLEWYAIDVTNLGVLLGSVLFCLGGASKYTVCDAAKEIAFIPLAIGDKMKGKLIIDGVISRFGKGFSCSLSMVIIMLFGGIGGSVIPIGLLVLLFGGLWVRSTVSTGKGFESLMATAKK